MQERGCQHFNGPGTGQGQPAGGGGAGSADEAALHSKFFAGKRADGKLPIATVEFILSQHFAVHIPAAALKVQIHSYPLSARPGWGVRSQ